MAPFCVLIVQFLRCFMPDINLVHPLIQNALKQENGIAERVINKECALSEKEIELIRKENELRVKEEELRKREETIRRERELLRREKDLRKREDELKRKETELLEIQARKKLKHSDSRRQAVSGNLGSNTRNNNKSSLLKGRVNNFYIWCPLMS